MRLGIGVALLEERTTVVGQAWSQAVRNGRPWVVRAELRRLSQAGCDEVLLFACSGHPGQVPVLAPVLRERAKASGRGVLQGVFPTNGCGVNA